MNTYFISIKMAVLLFPVVSIIATGVLFFILKKTKGKMSFWQGVMFYSFIFYCLSMFCLVVFPLPSVDAVANLKTDWVQIKPFAFATDFMQKTVLNVSDRSTYIPALTQDVVLQPLFNLIMFMPLGFYFAYFFKKPLHQTVIISFFISLFFEITQLSGLYGMYPRPYRLFDIDDLFLNTLGAAIGFIVVKSFLYVWNNHKKTAKVSLPNKYVASHH